MNPRKIASSLKRFGCHFSCQYIDYSIDLLYKKVDTTIDPDVLQMTFLLDSQSSWQTTVRGLDYTYDMLASDYGAIFGLLVGLSLIDTVTFLFAALKMLVQDLSLSDKQIIRRSYELIKWVLVTGLIGLLIILMFSTDFKALSIFLSEQSAATISVESEFLNPNSYDESISNNLTIKWGPEFSGKKKISNRYLSLTLLYAIHLVRDTLKSCPYKMEVGDGWCDDKANVEECLFDDNDCCKVGKELMPNANQFCQDCSCHVDELVVPRRKPGAGIFFTNG